MLLHTKQISIAWILTSSNCCTKLTTDMNKSQDTSQTFGECFRQKRVKAGFTLRSFCARFGFDPAYISRIERDLLPPPEDKDKLEGFAKALDIKEGSSRWVDFFDRAYLSKGKVPQDILDDRKSMKYLPLLFRTARGERLSKKKLKALVELLNKKS